MTLDTKGVGLTDHEYRTMLQLQMHKGEENDSISPPKSPTKVLRSGREVVNAPATSQPTKKRGQPKTPRETSEGARTPKRQKPVAPLYDDVENILDYPDPLPEFAMPRRPSTGDVLYPPPAPVLAPATGALGDNTITALNTLAQAIATQSQLFARHFPQKTPEPELPLFYDANPGHYVPDNVNGMAPNPPQERLDPRQSLWPHVENSTINAIIQGSLPLEKLILLVPVEHRSLTAERGDLTINNGVLQQTKPTPDVGKMAKLFPTLASYLRAFTTWIAIKQMYEVPDTHLAAARLMHIDGMLHLSTTASWNKLLRYELAFFRTHQKSRDPRTWSNLDSIIFLTSGLNLVAEQVHSEQRLFDRIMPCFRYNRKPAPGEKACQAASCKYQHVCNFDTERCNSRHPAYDCPLNGRRSDYRGEDRRPYNGKGGNFDRNPNRAPVSDNRAKR